MVNIRFLKSFQSGNLGLAPPLDIEFRRFRKVDVGPVSVVGKYQGGNPEVFGRGMTNHVGQSVFLQVVVSKSVVVPLKFEVKVE